MPRDYRLQLDDILTAVARIRRYVEGMDYDAFRADGKTQAGDPRDNRSYFCVFFCGKRNSDIVRRLNS